MIYGDPWIITTLCETVSEGVTLTDKLGHFALYNDAMEKITGYTSREARTLKEYLALLCQYRAGGEMAMLEVMDIFHRKCRERETMIRAKDGTHKNVCISTSPLEYQGGRFLLHVFRDITPLTMAEEKLLLSEKRYRMLCEQSFDAIVLIDPETFLPIDFNYGATLLFGYSKEEFSGIHLDTLETRGIFVQNKFRDKRMPVEDWEEFETDVYTKNTGIKNVKVSIRVVELSGRRLLQCLFHETICGKCAAIKTGKKEGELKNAPVSSPPVKRAIPLCYVCKKIYDDKGIWVPSETKVGARTDMLLSYELCPGCEEKFYPNQPGPQKREGTEERNEKHDKQ